MNKDMRTKISEILVKWGLSTRQVAIDELTNLINSQHDEIKREALCEHNYVFDKQVGYTDESTNYDCREMVYHCTKCGRVFKKSVPNLTQSKEGEL